MLVELNEPLSLTGDSKARVGVRNGRCSLSLDRYQTWKPLHMRFDVFLLLLGMMHKRRLAKAARPWLRVTDVPQDAGVPEAEAALIVSIMRDTKFGHPDRYQDACSKEILSAMRSSCCKARSVAVSLAVRYKSSPRDLASKLVKATKTVFEQLVCQETNGTAYEQTGNTKEDVSRGVLNVAEKIADNAPYADWEALEGQIAKEMKVKCNGNSMETFSARQSAADLCRLKGFVNGLGVGSTPKRCKLGPGAKKGWYFAERAEQLHGPKHIPAKIPQHCEFRRQTGYCEYMKLVKRFNFKKSRERAKYVPSR